MTSAAGGRNNLTFKTVLQAFTEEDFNEEGYLQPWKIALTHQYIRAIGVRLALKEKRDSLFKHHTVFVRHLSVSVNEKFLKKDILLSLPVYGLFSVLYCGDTSLLYKSSIIFENNQTSFSKCRVQMVYVSQETRKPTSLPDTVKNLLFNASQIKPEMVPLAEYKPSLQQPSLTRKYVISEEDVDYNEHTNNSSYLKFCVDVAREAISQGILHFITHDVLNSKLLEFVIHYLGETRLGDEVAFTVWQDLNNRNLLHFEATKGDVVFRCNLKFNLFSHSLL